MSVEEGGVSPEVSHPLLHDYSNLSPGSGV